MLKLNLPKLSAILIILLTGGLYSAFALSDVTQPGDALIASSPNSPGSEGVANAIDGQPTKYLNFDSGRDGANGGFSPSGFIVTPSVGATRVTGIALQSANDAPGRDPLHFTLEGSNDDSFADFSSGNWEVIADIDNITPWTELFPDGHRFQTQTFSFQNNKAYKHYRWTVLATQTTPNGCCMQIAEVELLGNVLPGDVTQPGDALIASSPNNPGSEGVANAIDGQPTKYLNFDSGRDGADGGFSPSGFIVTPSVGSTLVTGISLQSANDGPERDPLHMTLEGSNDDSLTDFASGNWEMIADINNITPWTELFPDGHRFQTQTFLFDNFKPYKHYRWTVLATQTTPNGCCMQIAEVELLGTGAPKDVTQPGDALIASSPNNPGSEGVANAIDGQPTKYLNFDSGRDGADNGFSPSGFVVTPSIGATTVIGLSMQSANDAPERDPRHVIVEGSNDDEITAFDSGNWEVIAEINDITPWTELFPDGHRFQTQSFYFANTTAYKHYRWTVLETQTTPNGCCMQIAEVELLAVSDTVPCDIAGFVTSPVDTPVLEGASATFFAEVNGPWPVQWLRNGEIIPGATSLTFTTDAVTAANADDEYAVEILGCAISLPVKAVLFTPSDTTSFGFSFVGGGANGAPTAMDPNDIAGVHQQANWNNVDDGATSNIVDSNGNASDISVTFPTTGEWGAGTGTDDANARLLNGLVQVGTGGTGSVVFNNIPAGNHAVIAYTVSRPLEFVNVDFAITGTDKVAFVRSMNSDEYNPAPGFFRGTSTNPGVRTIANYVRFDNITVEQFENIELTWTGAGGGQAVINGIQLLLNAPDPGTPPEIIVGPLPQGVSAGQDVGLEVVATGDDLTYQWRKNGKNLFDGGRVHGVNSSQLAILGFTEEDEGAYSVAVFNPAGSLISSPAVVRLSNFDITEGLVAHYKLDGNGNNSGSDSFPLVPTGVTYGPGQIGQAAEFDGFTSFGYAENITKARTGLSASAWVRVDPNVLNGFNVPMFIRNAEGGALNINETFEFGLFFNDINFTMHLGASIAVGPNISNAQDGMEFPLGEWQHVAFSADGATLRVYRNGELVAQTNYIDDINSPSVPWISVGARLADEGFGLFPDASLPDFMEGSMDDIAVWTRGLTADEVQGIYAQGVLGQDVTTVTTEPIPCTFCEGAGGPDLVSLPHPGTPGTGLDGRYWKAPASSILTIAEEGVSVMKSRLPDGTFTATSISYEGNDLTGITEWLLADGASFSGNASNLNDGLISFTGFIGVTEAGTVNFNVPSDDGVVVWISGQKVVDNDGSHGAPGPAPEGSFDFPDAGLYPIEIAYFNGHWTNEAGDHGGANINFTSDGGAGIGGAGEPVPVAALYSASAVGSAMVPASNAGMIPGEAGTGLSGRYWQLAPATLTNILDRGGDGDIGLKTIQSVTPSGYFNATTIDYEGNDLTPIMDWLRSDSSSYRGLEGNMDDGLISLKGFIAIDEAGEHTFSTPSDDGSIVWIGGVKVVDNDGSHGAPGPSPDGTAVFSAAGLYPIEIAYYNADWTDDAGNHGGANINFTMNGGDTVSSAILYPANNSFEMVGMDIGIEGDPVVPGSSEIRNPYPDVYDVDVVAGGSDIWGNDDSGHFVYTEWTGDFDATVEVTRLDVINQWSKAGISVRESLDTGSRHVYVNVDSAAEPPLDNPGGSGANTYEMGVRVATDGGTSNWDENGGTPRMNVADSTLPAWIRVTRLGDEYTAYRSSNGVEWTMMGSLVQDHPDTVFVSLGTTSHNNGGEEFLTTAHYRNFTIVTPMVDSDSPVMGISRSGAQVVITWDKGDLQSATSVTGPWTNVEVVQGRGQPAVPAASPFTADATGPGRFYRVVD